MTKAVKEEFGNEYVGIAADALEIQDSLETWDSYVIVTNVSLMSTTLTLIYMYLFHFSDLRFLKVKSRKFLADAEETCWHQRERTRCSGSGTDAIDQTGVEQG